MQQAALQREEPAPPPAKLTLRDCARSDAARFCGSMTEVYQQVHCFKLDAINMTHAVMSKMRATAAAAM